MKTYLITVGKLKNKQLEILEESYLKRIKNPKLQIHEVKAKAENKELEGEVVIKKIESLSSNPFIIVLSEFGKELDSPKFSKWYYENLAKFQTLIFVICGAEGPSKTLLNKANQTLSLSQMTLPHKLARLMLVEQIYRAETIQTGHPYHN
ncbi:MAG: 23S rRNA (pseudouridine(1915)-N(3))-methyltransferase RlmH [Bacteriovoracaceae bacterium]|nr:23S rRNA (pseudouridine(1915)-N(3))-methyltransferase RlmH [Bacteriovoracaceae bacterium]